MASQSTVSVSVFAFFLLVLPLCLHSLDAQDHNHRYNPGRLITREQRKTVVSTDSGQVTAVDVDDGYRGPYHLEFFTLEPNALFLPVLLHTDMVLYVHTGRGRLGWVEENDMNRIDIQKGDIFRLRSGSVFYFHSYLEPSRGKLRIHSIFVQRNGEDPSATFTGAYSSISEIVLGFDKKVLQAAFKVPEEVIDGIKKATKPPSIVHLAAKDELGDHGWKSGIIESLIGVDPNNGKKKKSKTLNIFGMKHDFENCNGWSLSVTHKDFHALKGSEIGIFMVNLTKGSMMGPHWNPRATEIAIVTHGRGMVHIVGSSSPRDPTKIKNSSFMVKEGDIFAVPRFHPMAQMSFNNDSLEFMGFSTMAKKNYPQFLAGKNSVLTSMDEDVLAMSFNAPNTTIRQILRAQVDSIILECTSCAEEELETEEKERKREDEEKKREEEERREEEARKREEEEREREEEKKKEEEEKREEEAKKREEEEREREEEKQKQEEEKREKEEARKREETERQREEEVRRREQQEEARQREEEARRRQEQEEEARQRKEEAKRRKEARRREEQEEEATRREEQEEEARRRQEQEEEARQREEEARRREEQEEEVARREEQEEEARQREEETRSEEEAKRREEQEEEARQREEETRSEEEARRREEQEEETRQREEETRSEEEQEEERRREEEEEEEEEEESRREGEERREKEEREKQEEYPLRLKKLWRV